MEQRTLVLLTFLVENRRKSGHALVSCWLVSAPAASEKRRTIRPRQPPTTTTNNMPYCNPPKTEKFCLLRLRPPPPPRAQRRARPLPRSARVSPGPVQCSAGRRDACGGARHPMAVRGQVADAVAQAAIVPGVRSALKFPSAEDTTKTPVSSNHPSPQHDTRTPTAGLPALSGVAAADRFITSTKTPVPALNGTV
ncbi:hypothetical protein EDC01DRAFT_641085 [Geopyxis carbonaria]|nr:hypothetical protein EDC01DRAFT_641085 [Geopyxis carbonaria]